MAIKNRKPSHLPRLEALEDRFLPSVSSVLPPGLANHSNQKFGNDLPGRSMEKGKADKISNEAMTVSSDLPGQSHLADVAFDSSQGDLTQMVTYRPILAVITYDPMLMQFQETIWFTITPIKAMAGVVKPKVAGPNSYSPDSENTSSILYNVIPPLSVSVNSITSARPKSTVDDLARELVETVTPASPNRMAETTPTDNQSVAGLAVNNTTVVLPKYSTLVTTPQEGEGRGLRSDTQPNLTQDSVPAPLHESTRGVVTTPDNESAITAGSRLTEKEGLNTDDSSLILNELQQVIQTLLQPFAVSLQSYEPSVLWAFLTTWVAAAGISYEYFRRKLQLNQISIDTWKEWRSFPLHHHS